MSFLLLIMPQVLLTHQFHLKLHLFIQLILVEVVKEVVDMGLETFDVVLDV